MVFDVNVWINHKQLLQDFKLALTYTHSTAANQARHAVIVHNFFPQSPDSQKKTAESLHL